MKGNCFIDTNILLYCYSTTEPVKREKAIKISIEGEAFISTQVISEFCNILRKKFNLGWDDIDKAVDELKRNFFIFINLPETITKACNLAGKYHFSFYDSLIIAAAMESGCIVLYTEDLNHNQLIDDTLLIVNPFLD